MIHRTFLMCFLIASALAFGQDQKVEPHSRYKLEFVLKQLDHGKVLSTHNFVMSAESNGSTSQVRTGNRIPIDLGGEKGLQYQDVGFSCDARINPVGSSNVGLEIGWELSTMPGATGSERVVRQVKGRSTPLAPVGKQTLVGSVDDINSGQQFELDVTVTPEQ